MKRIYSILFIALLLQACRIGKPYQQPELTLPGQLSNVSYADTSSIADIEWKQFFTDTTLTGLISRGLEYNHDLLQAVKRMDIAALQLRQSRALNHPELDLLVTGAYNRPSSNSLNGISAKNFLGSSGIENYQTMLRLSWEADIWGKIRNQKEAALAQYLGTYEGVKTVQTSLVAEIAQGYFNLLMLDQQLRITRRSLQLMDSFSVATRLLKDAGLATELAVEQAEAQRRAAEGSLPQIEGAIALQESNLQLLTGQLPGKLSRSEMLSGRTFPAQLPTGLPAALVSRRPDVRARELDLVAAHARTGIARANLYPALTLTAGTGLESFTSGNWWSVPGSLFGLAAGTIAQPLLKRRALKTAVAVSEAEREASVIAFRQSVLQAVTEVHNAQVRLEALKQQETHLTARAATLQSAVRNAQLLFKSDMANYLEVLTAQGNALQAQLELSQLQRGQWGAVIELYRALGGGWKAN
ncbi:MAG TPA: efflux transporter outer membrane subunit [Chitinophagaceae bacterium]|jgi:NodT family efflux transporter outer membrane factor (OMF) lipoprotein|nr:efflux transporter outer membrane subunit [Chitinophagaceae bacterium]